MPNRARVNVSGTVAAVQATLPDRLRSNFRANDKHKSVAISKGEPQTVLLATEMEPSDPVISQQQQPQLTDFYGRRGVDEVNCIALKEHLLRLRVGIPLRATWYKGEFGHELGTVVPLMNTLAICGLLASTTSCGDMGVFYRSSPNHTSLGVHATGFMRSKACYRTAGIESWYGVRVNNIMSSHTPRIRGTINVTQCTRASRCNFYVVPPPLYDQVRKQRLQKTHTPKHQHVPLLVIYNKYDPEWRGPVNFINPDVLKMIINEYQTVCPGGEVIYDRPGSPRSLAQGATGVVTDAGSMGTLQMSSNIDGKNSYIWTLV